MTNLELYERYHDPNTTDALKQSDFKVLKQRASYGNRDAAFYVSMIEACNNK
jgi:hypothetical protein